MTATLDNHHRMPAPAAKRCSTWCCEPAGRHTYHTTMNEGIPLVGGPVDPDEGRGADEVDVCIERIDKQFQLGTVIVPGEVLLRLELDREGRSFFGYATPDQAERLATLLLACAAMVHGLEQCAAMDAAEEGMRAVRARVAAAGIEAPAPTFHWDTPAAVVVRRGMCGGPCCGAGVAS